MIEIYFGLPGSGKTTFLAQIAEKSKKIYGNNIYSNVQLFNAKFIDSDKLKLLGQFTLPEYSLLLIDEAGIEFNNRDFKRLPKNLIKFAKLHRHYKVDIILFSQSYEDTDITFRRLACRFYRVFSIGPFSFARKIRPLLFVNEEKEIVDGYEYYPFLLCLFTFVKPFKACFRPLYYKYFDSWTREELPIFIGM